MSSVATLPTESRYSKLSYLTCAVLIWFHIQAVAALWSFSWTNLLVAVFLYWVAIGLGISMGYHRLHTHRGFKTYRLFEYFLAVCGTLTLEGGPIFWVATHRVHHRVRESRTGKKFIFAWSTFSISSFLIELPS
jgi:stearoyl-CoA desaturase (delta-9 desaturase)